MFLRNTIARALIPPVKVIYTFSRERGADQVFCDGAHVRRFQSELLCAFVRECLWLSLKEEDFVFACVRHTFAEDVIN